MEFGIPERARVVEMKPGEGMKITAYFQTFPLMSNEMLIGYVRVALAIAPQTHLVRAVQMKYLGALLLLFFSATAGFCYVLSRLLQPIRLS